MNDSSNVMTQKIIENSKFAYVGSVSNLGVPYIRAMLVEKKVTLGTFWFTTAYTTSKVEHFKNNPNASIYFADIENYQGVLLLGHMEIDNSLSLKEKFWKDYYITYYPGGINDLEYTVLKFRAEKVIFYDGHDTTIELI